jgi:GntR family transcriptional regulator
MATLHPHGALPAYLQISEAVSRDILSGKLLDGDKLPTERAMAEEFNIAVGTLRKALDLLVNQGLIERVHGSGNYVRHVEAPSSLYSLFRLELKTGGGLPRAKLRQLDRLTKPQDAPPFGPSKDAYRFRRLRYLDDQGAAIEEIWLDSRHAAQIDTTDVSESLYYFYHHDLGLLVSSCTDRITIAPVPDWADPAFAPAPATLCPYIERIAFNQHIEAFEFSRTWYDPDVAQYVSRLK